MLPRMSAKFSANVIDSNIRTWLSLLQNISYFLLKQKLKAYYQHLLNNTQKLYDITAGNINII